MIKIIKYIFKKSVDKQDNLRYNVVVNNIKEAKTVLTITETKNEATTIIEMLKQLPKEKQEFVNGYIQGVADTIAEQKEPA